MQKLRIIGCLIIFFVSYQGNSQGKVHVFFDGTFVDSLVYQVDFQKNQLIQQITHEQWSRGYLFCGLDSATTGRLYFHLGNKYNLKRMKLYLNQDGQRNEMVVRGNINETLQKELRAWANHGYPFAAFQWDSIIFSQNINGYLSFVPGPEIRYDSITTFSKIGLSKKYLGKVTGFEIGALFNEREYITIPERVSRLGFVALNRPPDVAFENGKAYLFLDIEEKKYDTFEGIVGLLPRQSISDQLVVTGYLDLSLSNLFNSGKSFGFTWNRFADESQSLDLAYNHPFFLDSKLFLRTSFNLLKQDSTFLTQSWQIQTGSNIGAKSEIQFGFESKSGSMITPSERFLKDGIGDFKTQNYMIGLGDMQFSRSLPFKNDFRYFINGSIGNKEIVVNPSLTMESYDSLKLKSIIIKWQGGIKYLYKIRDRLAFYQKWDAQLLLNEQLFDNELSRLGGLKTIRGFNEQFFYAQHYFNSRQEIRQYFESASYLMMFLDWSYLLDDRNNWVNPKGFGAGINLETNNGLLTFAFALGTTKQIPLDAANIKIHLGYKSTF